jgi:hypothetical protein
MMKTLILILLSCPLFAQSLQLCDNEVLKVPMRVDGVGSNFVWSIYPSADIQANGSFAQAEITEHGTFTVTVDFETELGCSYQVSGVFEVDTCPSWTIWIPNAISPNGVNRTWIPEGENIELLSIEIYDRWGKVQFSTKDSPFLGLNNNGNELDGVFTYRVYFRELIKNSFQEKIGSVVVVR